MKYTVKDSSGARVTSVRIGKGNAAKTLLADITGVFTLDEKQVLDLCKAGYRVTAPSRKIMRALVTGNGQKPRTLALSTAQIVDLFRMGYSVDPVSAKAPTVRKRSNEPTIPLSLYRSNGGRS